MSDTKGSIGWGPLRQYWWPGHFSATNHRSARYHCHLATIHHPRLAQEENIERAIAFSDTRRDTRARRTLLPKGVKVNTFKVKIDFMGITTASHRNVALPRAPSEARPGTVRTGNSPFSTGNCLHTCFARRPGAREFIGIRYSNSERSSRAIFSKVRCYTGIS